MGKNTDVRVEVRTETADELSDRYFLATPPTTLSPDGKNQVHFG